MELSDQAVEPCQLRLIQPHPNWVGAGYVVLAWRTFADGTGSLFFRIVLYPHGNEIAIEPREPA